MMFPLPDSIARLRSLLDGDDGDGEATDREVRRAVERVEEGRQR